MSEAWLRRRIELERMMGVDALIRGPGVEDELGELEQQVKQCTRCRLHETRTQGVCARGRADAPLMFIGEAPGAEEDRQGVPFVGRAGKLLDQMIIAMGLELDEVYITNIIKSRPPQNREPRSDEIEACWPYLERQIELVQPRIICTLGRPASNTVLRNKSSMGELRGRWFSYGDIPVLPTYHPAYLLRSPAQKKSAWEDLKKVVLALSGVQPPPPAAGLF